VIRFCPNCQTERPVEEVLCEGELDGSPCGWDLSALPIRPEGWRLGVPMQSRSPASIAPHCVNGHAVEVGDLICTVCGGDIADETPSVTPSGKPRAEANAPAILGDGEGTETLATNTPSTETSVAGWRLLRRLPTASNVLERYETIRDADDRQAVLTLYANGSEPDLEVYEVLRTLAREHVPEILETGRWEDRAYEVSEDVRGGTLADLGPVADDILMLSRILSDSAPP
jgi:primosomal replication protein N''